jgi:uncharacterized membrane protein
MKSLVLLLLLPVTIVVHGFVLSHLWAWFVVPATGLPPVGWDISFGLAMFLHYGSAQNSDRLDTSEKITEYVVSRLIFLPSGTLFIGWILSKIAQ